MLNQSFSPRGILALTTRADVRKHRLWDAPADRDTVAAETARELSNPNYVFPALNEKTMGKSTVFSAPDYTTAIGLRKIDYDLKHIYKVKQANRDRLIRQVKALCSENCSYSVLRLDIKSFYENADRERILEWINNDAYLSPQSRRLIVELLNNHQFSSFPGLPRGIAISATLSELYLRNFDRQFREQPHVYFYGRYVDDIVVFSTESVEQAEVDARKIAESCSVVLNDEKFIPLEVPNETQETQTFSYLGYEIEIANGPQKLERWRTVKIRISEKKIKKIKSRVISALHAFTRDHNFELLLLRIRVLTSNFTMRENDGKRLLSGIAYNYKAADSCEEQLEDLQEFYLRLVFARTGRLGLRLAPHLSDAQRNELKKLSFVIGHATKWSVNISETRLKEAFECWRYEKN